MSRRFSVFFFHLFFIVVLLETLLFQFEIVHGRTQNNKNKCHEKALEKREENANVIFSGTVQDVFPDERYPGFLKAHVEIKRILKGSDIIKELSITSNKRPVVVVVNGFLNPYICRSTVKKYDTRIFLVNKIESELKLNSSLVTISLRNLDHVEAVVKDEKLTLIPDDQEDPCQTFFCAFGAQCIVDLALNEPLCKCLDSCSDIFAPVCGNDNVTYMNECHLQMSSCKQQKKIRIVTDGSCSKRKTVI